MFIYFMEHTDRTNIPTHVFDSPERVTWKSRIREEGMNFVPVGPAHYRVHRYNNTHESSALCALACLDCGISPAAAHLLSETSVWHEPASNTRLPGVSKAFMSPVVKEEMMTQRPELTAGAGRWILRGDNTTKPGRQDSACFRKEKQTRRCEYSHDLQCLRFGDKRHALGRWALGCTFPEPHPCVLTCF